LKRGKNKTGTPELGNAICIIPPTGSEQTCLRASGFDRAKDDISLLKDPCLAGPAKPKIGSLKLDRTGKKTIF